MKLHFNSTICDIKQANASETNQLLACYIWYVIAIFTPYNPQEFFMYC